MRKSEKVAISVPKDLLKAVQKECKTSGETRSAFFARAAAAELRRQQEIEDDRRYVEAYRRMPETPEEIADVAAIGQAGFEALEPWNEKG